jgi:hypothetical protein
VVVEFANNAAVPCHCSLNRILTMVGRLPTCKLQLSDVSVSRYHCSLLHTPQGVWAIDLLSREGTIVNGQHVRWARLEDGARLQVGRHRIRLWYETPPSGEIVSGAVGRVEDASWLPVASPGSDQFLPVPAARGDVQERSLLLPIINQFNLMHQQLADQFHQTMLMMAQLFSRLHHDQMQQLREELDQVHHLTRELQELQAEQLRHSSEVGILRVQSESTSPTATAPAVANGQTESDQGAWEPAKTDAAPAGAPAPPPPPQHPETLAGARNDADIHVWLSERISALQEERRGRWQKILSFVLGR